MKTRKAFIALLALLFLTTLSTGCATTYTPTEFTPPVKAKVFDERPPAEGLTIKDAIKYEGGYIRESIGIMTEEDKTAARGVTIVVYHSNDVTHFNDTYGWVVVGHYHRDTKEVCLRANYLDRETIWHEICHAYHDTLPEKFDEEWLDAADDVYGKDYEKVKFPVHGLLKKYASVSYVEDVATWVEEAYSCVCGLGHNLGRVDRSDPVYLKKLDLLLKWKFINEEDYMLIKPIISKK